MPSRHVTVPNTQWHRDMAYVVANLVNAPIDLGRVEFVDERVALGEVPAQDAFGKCDPVARLRGPDHGQHPPGVARDVRIDLELRDRNSQ